MDNKIGWIVLLVFVVGGLFYAVIKYTGTPLVQQKQAVPVLIVNPFGTVTKKTANGFTILGVGDKSITVHTTENTEFLAGSSVKSSADISVGTIVSITSSVPNADGSIDATVVQIIPPPPVLIPAQ